VTAEETARLFPTSANWGRVYMHVCENVISRQERQKTIDVLKLDATNDELRTAAARCSRKSLPTLGTGG